MLAAPVKSEKPPETPELADPVLNRREPLTPVAPASGDKIVRSALDVAVPEPLEMETDPPEEPAVAIPPATVRAPPVPLVLRPAITVTEPPVIAVPTLKVMAPLEVTLAAPVNRDKLPETPELAVPDLNSKDPLTPVAPASGVIIDMSALEVAAPAPLEIVMDPPVPPVVATPPAIDTLPPTAFVALPAKMLTEPPMLVPVPMLSVTAPPEPELAAAV
jgi:hypothetical protein